MSAIIAYDRAITTGPDDQRREGMRKLGKLLRDSVLGTVTAQTFRDALALAILPTTAIPPGYGLELRFHSKNPSGNVDLKIVKIKPLRKDPDDEKAKIPCDLVDSTGNDAGKLVIVFQVDAEKLKSGGPIANDKYMMNVVVPEPGDAAGWVYVDDVAKDAYTLVTGPNPNFTGSADYLATFHLLSRCK